MQKPFSFRGLSIQQRLPLLICLLLLCIMVTFSWISYLGLKNAALKTGKDRLRSLTDQLSSMFAQSSQATLAATRLAANQEPIKNCFQSSEPSVKIEALYALRKLRPDSTWVLAELLDRDHKPIIRSSRDSLLPRTNFDSATLSLPLRDSATIGKIFLIRDSMYYPVIAPVSENKLVIGHLVRWRLVLATPKTLERFSQLMGTKAKLYLGNNDGSLWTDLIKPVTYQQMDSSHLQEPVEYTGAGRSRFIAAARPIANTPWLVSVEFPQHVVLDTANRFLRWIVIAGSLLIILGIFVAWAMSRSITRPLNKLTGAATSIANGDYSAKVAVERRDEVGKLSRAFNAMIEQVSKAKHGLEQKIVESAEMNEQLRDLSAYLQNVREDERIHIAREMHDELGQVLTGFKMDVSWLRKKLADNKDPVVQEKLENLISVIDDTVKFVWKLASELRPSILDDLGLVPALEWHIQEFEKRYTIKTAFHSHLPDLDLSPVVATGLFRMFQESLTNEARHSNATKVVVDLNMIGDEIHLSISDNGKGFDASQANKKTLGLLGMKERAAMIGGNLEISSEPGKGTTINITVKPMLGERARVS